MLATCYEGVSDRLRTCHGEVTGKLLSGNLALTTVEKLLTPTCLDADSFRQYTELLN